MFDNEFISLFESYRVQHMHVKPQTNPIYILMFFFDIGNLRKEETRGKLIGRKIFKCQSKGSGILQDFGFCKSCKNLDKKSFGGNIGDTSWQES